MTLDEGSTVVDRYVRRPMWWSALALLASAALFGLDLHSTRIDERAERRALRVEGMVLDDYGGGDSVPFRYRHPVTDETLDVTTVVWRRDLRPGPGDTVDLAVSARDPDDVGVPGDRQPWHDGLWVYAPMVGLFVLVSARRAWHVHRVRRLIARHSPSFAMFGAFGPPRRGGRRPLLSLYPLDSPAGAPPLCCVPVLSTRGAPFASLLTVEAKGSPRPHGRIVVHTDDVLWPTGRAAGRGGIPRPARAVDAAPELPSLPVVFDPPSVTAWLRTMVVEGILLSAAVVLVVAVSVVTAGHAAAARDLEQTGVHVIATVIERGESSVEVRYVNGDSGELLTDAPVDYPEDYTLGRRYPAVVAPDGSRLRLLAEPYDRVEPIVWASLPLVAMVVVVTHRVVGFHGVRRAAAAGPTRCFHARVASRGRRLTDLEIGSAGEPGPRCRVRVPNGEVASFSAGEVMVRGEVAPGSPLAVAIGRRPLSVVGPGQSPRPPE